MRYPQFLKEGGCVGFAAPSFGCNIEPYRSAFDHALEVMRAKGYSVHPGPNAYEGEGIGISNTPRLCAAELTEAYLSEDSDVLISCGGGELMCEILDYVDFNRIREAVPKWFMGYSDNTNMTFLLTTLCDTAAIYGPCAPAFGMEPWHPAISDAWELLHGRKLCFQGYDSFETESLKTPEHPLEPYNVSQPRKIRSFVPSREENEENPVVQFSGRLIGGCMDCLVNLTGTMYDRVREFNARYEKDGMIWFLESCDLNVFAIRRAIWQMKHAGWFEHVRGFLIGRPYCHGQEMMGLDQYRAVTDLLEEYQVPILMDIDLGHLPPMIPIISGSVGRVTYEDQKLEIQMDLV